MERTSNADNHIKEPLHCPKCGSVLDLHLVEVRDEDGDEGELLLLLDCPQDDFYATVTYEDVVAALTTEVRERLTASRRSPAP